MKEDLLNRLREDLELYGSLHDAANEQLTRLKEDDSKGFRSAASKRASIQRRISQLNDSIAGAFKKNPSLISLPEVHDSKGEIEKILQRIIEIDLEAANLAVKMRDEAAKELNRLKKGRDGVRGYARQSKSGPRFIDRQG
jgi:hypothetical protein